MAWLRSALSRVHVANLEDILVLLLTIFLITLLFVFTRRLLLISNQTRLSLLLIRLLLLPLSLFFHEIADVVGNDCIILLLQLVARLKVFLRLSFGSVIVFGSFLIVGVDVLNSGMRWSFNLDFYILLLDLLVLPVASFLGGFLVRRAWVVRVA